MAKLFFTFIIPHRRFESIDRLKKQIRDSCSELRLSFEIFDVSGNQPTYQRNRCIEKSKGDYIYFLDNDSYLLKKSLEVACQCFEADKELAVLGGPSMAKPGDSPFQMSIAKLFSSYLSTGLSSNRYTQRGGFRNCDDQELILCNMIVKRSVFEQIGLFNENLYPNEENEFIFRVMRYKMKVCHHPEVKIHRSHRRNYRLFFKQMFGYGRGRAEQTKINPKSFKKTLLLPILFTIYLILLMGVVFSCRWYLTPLVSLMSLPLAVYLVLMLTAMWEAKPTKWEIIHFPFLFFISHISYSLGFIARLLWPFKKKKKLEIYFLKKE